MKSWQLTCALLALIAAGCTYSPAVDLTCETEGATRNGAICQDGVWVKMNDGEDVDDEACSACAPPSVTAPTPDDWRPVVLNPELATPDLELAGTTTTPELRLVFDRPAAEDLDDFIALVRVQSTAFVGEDVVFVDEDDEVLDHDVETFDQNTGELLAWVRLPVLAATGDTTVVVRVAEGSDRDPDPERVWRDYEAVFHLSDDSNATGDRDGRNHGSTPAPGQIGEARAFNGLDQWIDTRAERDLEEWSVSVWVNGANMPMTAEGVNGPLMRDGNYEIVWDHPDPRFAGAAGVRADEELFYASFGALAENRWHHLAATFDGEELKSYHNGVLVAVNNTVDDDPQAPRDAAAIGRSLQMRDNPAAYFAGLVDEVRIADEVRSPAWFEASYRNQQDPTGFYTVTP